jgi:hypothetical protein
MYGVLPPIVDLTETHVFHPNWTGHARFHMVWLLFVNSTLAALVVLLAWWPGPQRDARMTFGAILGTVVLGGFMGAVATLGLYGGTLTDPGGVPPGPGGLDLNILVFSVALLLQLVALAICVKQKPV